MKLLAAAANNSGSYSMIIIIVLMFVLMYFMMYRPQKKQQQERQKMLNQIKVGDPVITIGGLHGVIDSMNDADKTVVLDCDGIYLTFSRSAIRGVNKAADASAEAPKSASAAPKAAASDDNKTTTTSQNQAADPEEKTTAAAASEAPDKTDNATQAEKE